MASGLRMSVGETFCGPAGSLCYDRIRMFGKQCDLRQAIDRGLIRRGDTGVSGDTLPAGSRQGSREIYLLKLLWRKTEPIPQSAAHELWIGA